MHVCVAAFKQNDQTSKSNRPAHLYHRLYQGVRRCHLHLPAVGYCMTATFACQCIPVHLPCTYTLTTYRNGHTSKPTIPGQHMARWRPHPVNGELSIIIYPSSLGRVGHCGTIIATALPDFCLVVGSKEVHEETISAWW